MVDLLVCFRRLVRPGEDTMFVLMDVFTVQLHYYQGHLEVLALVVISG